MNIYKILKRRYYMKIKKINVNDYLTKSNFPSSDYVITPYIGFSHGCRYCYVFFYEKVYWA